MSMSDPLNHLGSIWYSSGPSDSPVSQTSFLVGTFVCFLQLDRSGTIYSNIKRTVHFLKQNAFSHLVPGDFSNLIHKNN